MPSWRPLEPRSGAHRGLSPNCALFGISRLQGPVGEHFSRTAMTSPVTGSIFLTGNDATPCDPSDIWTHQSACARSLVPMWPKMRRSEAYIVPAAELKKPNVLSRFNPVDRAAVIAPPVSQSRGWGRAHRGTVLRPLYTKGFQLTALLMPIRAENRARPQKLRTICGVSLSAFLEAPPRSPVGPSLQWTLLDEVHIS